MKRERTEGGIKRRWHLIALSLLILAVWSNSIPNGFVWDDSHVILNNHFIRDLGNLRHLVTSEYFARPAAGHYTRSGELSYRPVTTLTHFVDFRLFGLNPWGYHLFSLLIHGLTTLLVFALLEALVRGRTGPFLGAALFGVHTVHTEVVNTVSYRDDLLVCLFFCAALLAHRWAIGVSPERTTDQPKETERLSYRRLSLSLSLLALALFSKEMAVTFTAVVILHDFVFLGAGPAIRRGGKAYILYAALTALYLGVSFRAFPNRPHQLVEYPGGAWLTAAATSARVLVHDVRLLVAPVGLKVDYDFRISSSPLEWPVALSLVLLATLTALIVLSRSRTLRFFSLWFIVTLAPVLGFIPIANLVAERYLYLPSIGCAGAAAWVMAKAANRTEGREGLRRAGLVFICFALLALSVLTFQRSGIWRDDLTFFREMVEVTPTSHKGYGSLGIAYLGRGDVDLAVEALREAVKLGPSSAISHHNLASALIRKGDYDEAERHLARVLEIDPAFVEAHYQRALIKARRGEVTEAIRGLLRSLDHNPNFIPSLLLVGALYRAQGRLEEAIDAFRSVLRWVPDNAKAHLSLGALLLEAKGDCVGARAHYDRYFELRPDESARAEIEAKLSACRS